MPCRDSWDSSGPPQVVYKDGPDPADKELIKRLTQQNKDLNKQLNQAKARNDNLAQLLCSIGRTVARHVKANTAHFFPKPFLEWCEQHCAQDDKTGDPWTYLQRKGLELALDYYLHPENRQKNKEALITAEESFTGSRLVNDTIDDVITRQLEELNKQQLSLKSKIDDLTRLHTGRSN